MSINRTCDGQARRDFLRAGAAAGLGLNLAGYLRMAEAGAVKSAPKARSVIYIHLAGGPSHVDTFDPKPDAPTGIRGEFKPIKTNVDGVVVSEHLPKLAGCADKFLILRGVTHNLAAHDIGARYVTTGNRPIASLQFPSIGSVVSKELPCSADLPPFVAIPNTAQTAGYLGVGYSPLSLGTAPKPTGPYKIRGISLADGVTVTELERRQNLLADLDTAFKGYDSNDLLLRGLDKFSHQAHDIISSSAARTAFDITQETAPVRESFGPGGFGQSCLMACRLAAAGVRFITLTFGGWDTHAQNFQRLKTVQLPELDAGLAALFKTLAQRGLLESTAVVVTGEFGRTPKINATAGRDHWPRAMFTLLAGGAFASGQVIGASDKEAMGPEAKGITPDEVAATVYTALGIDFHKEYHTTSGRPVQIIREGKIIPGVLA